MRKARYFLKEAGILLLTISLILTSVVVTADKKNMQQVSNHSYIKADGPVIISGNNKNELSQGQNPINAPKGKFISVLRGWAVGNASYGKLIGSHGIAAKINFNYFQITRLKFFPIRWEMAFFYNVTAIIFGFNQTIYQEPFDFQKDWVLAIVIH